MMGQGLVQVGYSKKIEEISSIESQGHIPFDILYQRRETPTSFHIHVPMISHTPIQIPNPIPFQIPVQIPTKLEDPILFNVSTLFPYESTEYVP